MESLRSQGAAYFRVPSMAAELGVIPRELMSGLEGEMAHVLKWWAGVGGESER